MKKTHSLFENFLSSVGEKEYKIFDAVDEENNEIFKDITVNIQESSNTLIIYGENCSGKSLFTNILEIIARDDGFAVRSASIKNRTKAGMERALVVGDDSEQSTGETSVSFAIKSLKSTQKFDENALSILDEPDIGLSDYYAGAFGKLIGEFSNKFEVNKGLVIISHSKKLMNAFLKESNKNISTLGINTTLSLEDWLKREDVASIDELENLMVQGHRKKIAIHKASL